MRGRKAALIADIILHHIMFVLEVNKYKDEECFVFL